MIQDIGKAKIIISSRFNENVGHFKYNKPEKSAISALCIEVDHSFNNNSYSKKTVRPNARKY